MKNLSELIIHQNNSFNSFSTPILTQTLEILKARFQILSHLFRTAYLKEKSVSRSLTLLKNLRQKYSVFFNEKMLTKIAKVDGRYFWRAGAPGYPSKALRMVHQNELDRITNKADHHIIRTLFFGITRKCPLNCEHCYEWLNLHEKEILTQEDLISIVNKYQQYGTAQIFLGGGEPMLRFNDILSILDTADDTSEFWIYTSGFHLGLEQASQLKKHGLTGAMISLDHFLPNEHDHFRGKEGIYQQALDAVMACNQAKLVTGLAICTVNPFVNESNLRNYMELARNLGVSFVQFLEPKAAGRYQNKEVQLTPEKQKLLENIYHEYNHDPRFKNYPIINYPDYLMRGMGCISGDRTVYINTKGEIQLCPFCHHNGQSAKTLPVEEAIHSLQSIHCLEYHKSEV